MLNSKSSYDVADYVGRVKIMQSIHPECLGDRGTPKIFKLFLLGEATSSEEKKIEKDTQKLKLLEWVFSLR